MIEDRLDDLVRDLREKRAAAKLIGEAPAFRRAMDRLRSVARCDATALITGGTGTGKELAARAIHYMSDRAGEPFVAVNCGSLPDTLLEAELFGHERGAFTDAKAKRIGLIAQAEGGTLFLDEVDAVSIKAQASLLRVLQDKTFRPLGTAREQRANVRFVAASNARLERLLESGDFREDLYYRLCVFEIHMPKLCERKEDIPLLAAHFMEKAAGTQEAPELSPQALVALCAHEWPGNVRELENVLLRGVHLCKGRRIEVDDLELPGCRPIESTGPRQCADADADAAPPPSSSQLGMHSYRTLKKRAVDTFERAYLTKLLRQHGGNVSQAARAVGKERRDLGRLLKKHRLDPRSFVEE